jgi:hypothetical protein
LTRPIHLGEFRPIAAIEALGEVGASKAACQDQDRQFTRGPTIEGWSSLTYRRRQPPMQKRIEVAHKFEIGDAVVVPWGIDEVRGSVAEVYGPAHDRRVVVVLTPELRAHRSVD